MELQIAENMQKSFKTALNFWIHETFMNRHNFLPWFRMNQHDSAAGEMISWGFILIYMRKTAFCLMTRLTSHAERFVVCTIIPIYNTPFYKAGPSVLGDYFDPHFSSPVSKLTLEFSTEILAFFGQFAGSFWPKI